MPESTSSLYMHVEVSQTGVSLYAVHQPCNWSAFQQVKDNLIRKLLTDLFQGSDEHIPKQDFTQLPVNKDGLSLSYLTLSALENWTESCVITGHLMVALWGWTELRSGKHTILLKYGRV